MRQLVTMSIPRSRERVHAGTQLIVVFFFKSGISTCGTVLLTFGVALTPVNISRNSFVDMPRVAMNTVKVTVLIVIPELASETP